MIKITKGQSNIVVVTLKEAIIASNIVSPYYLFAIKNDQSKTVYYCICQDSSSYPDRYSKFTIIETDGANPVNGEITLSIAGFYSYSIYEQSSSTNIDPALCDNTTAIEIGKVQVIGTDTVNIIHDYNEENIVYNG